MTWPSAKFRHFNGPSDSVLPSATNFWKFQISSSVRKFVKCKFSVEYVTVVTTHTPKLKFSWFFIRAASQKNNILKIGLDRSVVVRNQIFERVELTLFCSKWSMYEIHFKSMLTYHSTTNDKDAMRDEAKQKSFRNFLPQKANWSFFTSWENEVSFLAFPYYIC